MLKELWSFLVSVLCGAVIASLYDIVKIRRRVIKRKKLWTGIEDVLFWTVCALIVFVVVLIVNDGLFRAYLFIGMLIGAGMYKKIFSHAVVSFFTTIIFFSCNIIKKALKIVLNVLKWFYNIFKHKRKSVEVQK